MYTQPSAPAANAAAAAANANNAATGTVRPTNDPMARFNELEHVRTSYGY